MHDDVGNTQATAASEHQDVRMYASMYARPPAPPAPFLPLHTRKKFISRCLADPCACVSGECRVCVR
jgi:hypothetical protein